MAQTAQKKLFGDKVISADSFVQKRSKVDLFKEAAKIAVGYVEGEDAKANIMAQSKSITADQLDNES